MTGLAVQGAAEDVGSWSCQVSPLRLKLQRGGLGLNSGYHFTLKPRHGSHQNIEDSKSVEHQQVRFCGTNRKQMAKRTIDVFLSVREG